MNNIVSKILSCSRFAPFIMAVISATALGLALVSQYVFGLEPCVLCIYQRWPYGIVIALGLIGFLSSFKCRRGSTPIMTLIGLTFLANSVIAFYHTGVELKWWPSHLEGCAVPKMGGSMEDVLANIQSRTKAVRCDEIPWSDPILNLSMANYNVIVCLALAVFAFMSAKAIYKKAIQ